MDVKIKNYLGLTLIAGIALLIVAGFWYVNAFATSTDFNRTFEARGEGEVTAIPDVAEMTFGVETEGGEDIAALQTENSEKVNRIISVLEDRGVDEKDIQTQSYNISPRRQTNTCPPEPRPVTTEEAPDAAVVDGEEEQVDAQEDVSTTANEPCPPSEIVGYTVRQNVSVKIRDIDMAGSIVAEAVENGANNVYGPTFTIDDPTELENEARSEAIAQAKENAQATAEAGGFQLGKLISVQENVSNPPVPYLERALSADEAFDGAAPSIQPGSEDVTVDVVLTYEIK